MALGKMSELHLAGKAVEKAAKSKFTELNTNNSTAGNIMSPGPSDNTLTDEEKTDLEALIKDIVPCFDELCDPDPVSFDHLINEMGEVAAAFGVSQDKPASPDTGKILVAMDDMTRWDGTMKQNLVDNYLSPFPTIMGNHGRLASYLSLRAGDMKAIYEGRRDRALEIAKKTVTSLESLKKAMDTNVEWLLAGLIIGGVALGGVAPFLKPATNAINVLGASLVIGATIGGPLKGEKKAPETVDIPGGRTMPLSGSSVEEILDNMWAALKELEKVVSEAEDKVKDDLRIAQADLEIYFGRPPSRNNRVLPIKTFVVGAPRDRINTGTNSGLVPFNSGGDGDSGGDGGRGSYHGPGEPPPGWDGAWDQKP